VCLNVLLPQCLDRCNYLTASCNVLVNHVAYKNSRLHSPDDNSQLLSKDKAKQSRDTPWWCLGGEYIYLLLILTSALDVVCGQRHAPGKGPPVSIVQEAWWAPEPVWTQRLEEKTFAPVGDRIPIARSSNP
jgi:hypothetical protein